MLESSERENIFARIREALRVPAIQPHDPTNHETEPQEHPHAPSDFLPFVGPVFQDRVDLFAKNSAELKTQFQMCDSPEQTISQLREVAIANDWKRIAAHRGGLTEHAVAALGLPVLWTDDGYDVRELEQCDAGLTACDALIAQTGSVLVTSKSAGGRALSVLPPHHVALARREQLIADLPAAFELLSSRHGSACPSFISLITGPSRTGDIERILVLGAHGPKKLTVLCY